ncbi:hypothetical protein D3C79_944360 [compost metagenome]
MPHIQRERKHLLLRQSQIGVYLPQRGERLRQVDCDLVIVVVVREFADNFIDLAAECPGTLVILHKTDLFQGHLLLHEL